MRVGSTVRTIVILALLSAALVAIETPAAEASTCDVLISDEAELTSALTCHNALVGGADTTITLDASFSLTSVVIVDNATTALIIDGGDNTLTAPASPAAAIQIDNGAVTVRDIVVTGGQYGFDLRNASTLELVESTISNADELAVTSSIDHVGSFSMLRSRFDGNDNGVEIYGTVTITDSTILNTTSNAVTTRGGVTIKNSTLADNSTGLRIGNGATTVENTTIAFNTGQAVTLAYAADGTATFIDSMSINNNGACSNSITSAHVFDGGGNVVNGNCGEIAYTPGASLASLPPLAQNPCATGVACTETVALPAGFLATGFGETCALTLDQRGEPRPVTDCDSGSFELSNEAPTAVNDDFGSSVDEDDPATALDVLANDSDPEADDLVVTAVSDLTVGAGSVVIDVDGLGVTYTPAANFNGSVSFNYAIADAYGGTASASASLSVIGVNDPPTAVDDDLQAVQGANGNTGDDVTLRVIDNDFDVDGQTFTINGVTQPVPPEAGQVFRSGDQESVIFRPSATYAGDSTFTYTLIDSFGGGNSVSDPATVFVATSATNSDPIAIDDTFPDHFTIDEDAGPTSLDVLANDSDPDGNDIDVVSVAQPSVGSAAVVDGELIFTAPDDYFGFIQQFEYTISDGNGGSATAFVNVEVTSVNDDPTAVDDDEHVDEDSGPNMFRPMDNDSDIESTSLTLISVNQPSQGSVAILNDFFAIYTHPGTSGEEGYTGTTSFDYTIEDPDGGTSTATFTITIDQVNDAPHANQDTPLISTNSTGNIIDVLANDTDPEDDSLTVIAVTQPANGTVVIGPGGADVRYTPDTDYVSEPQAPDEFTYTISDGNGGEDIGTAKPFVANSSPSIVDDEFVIDTAPVMVLDVLANDSDADPDDELTITSATYPFPIAAGQTRIAADGKSIEFIPLHRFQGTATFHYSVSDGAGGGSSAVVTVTASPNLACDPNYLPCIPISSADLNCGDIDIAVYVVGDDIHHFDGNGDGTGCESRGDLPVLPALCDGKVVTIFWDQTPVATSGDDVIQGTSGAETIDALAGNDTVCALGGDDVINGGDGDDVLFAGNGNDQVTGGNGKDRIRGQNGNDVINGNDGNDNLNGNNGNDMVNGGNGHDYVAGNDGSDTVTGGDGTDTINGGGKSDVMRGGPGNDTMNGNGFRDVIYGGTGNDTISGGDGPDELFGETGNDAIDGNRGNDTINGGPGFDSCEGRTGFDTQAGCEVISNIP